MKLFSKIVFLSVVLVSFFYFSEFKPVADLEERISATPKPLEQYKRTTFNTAKRTLRKIYNDADKRTTFYCGCAFNENAEIDLASCGYTIRRNAARAKRIEWEHVVPASFFGNKLPCWHNDDYTPGRTNCQRRSDMFNIFEGDLHNLVPEIGELNADRSNLLFSEGLTVKSQYGKCEFKIDIKRDAVEPRNEVKGDVARIWLYMNDKYDMNVSSTYREMLIRWHQNDPPSEFEKWKNRKVKEFQGDSNPYVEKLP